MQEKRFKILRVSECSARTFKFDFKHRDTGKEENISIFEYFKRKYNIHLQYPDIPVLEMTKRGVTYPMEVCHMLGGQRYPYKLNELAVRSEQIIWVRCAKTYDRPLL